MSIVREFKAFAMKGSVVDLAVGVIIGGAFGKIVASLVENILMPPIGLLIGIRGRAKCLSRCCAARVRSKADDHHDKKRFIL